MSSNEGKGSADPELTGKNGGEFIKPSNSDQSQQDYGTADELIMQQVDLLFCDSLIQGYKMSGTGRTFSRPVYCSKL